jgi:hypothetical protein
LFGEPDKMVELYNALTGSAIPQDAPVEIATLADALFTDRINDLAFVVEGKLVVLIEHQSTLCENMPLRLLIYIARVYEKLIDDAVIYRSKLIKIPKPEFFVLYNGSENFEDTRTLRLSDAFQDISEIANIPNNGGILDLEVKIINVNSGRNAEILRKSENLEGYAFFIMLDWN